MTERKPTCVACKGAGGGGTTYTAGEGIKIESNEISADTTVLQSKLTAGTGIDLTNDEVSVDTDTVALKSDIISGFELVDPSNYSSLYTSTSTRLEFVKDVIMVKDNCLTHFIKGTTFSGTKPDAYIIGNTNVEGTVIPLVYKFKIRDFFLDGTDNIGLNGGYNIHINKSTGSNEGRYQILFPYTVSIGTTKNNIKIYARD